jgi:hypothetical protein
LVLNLNTEKRSWWLTNSIGCSRPIPPQLLFESKDQFNSDSSTNYFNLKINNTSSSSSSLNDLNNFQHTTGSVKILPDNYIFLERFIKKNCVLPYYWIEIMHSAVLIFFAVNNSTLINTRGCPVKPLIKTKLN